VNGLSSRAPAATAADRSTLKPIVIRRVIDAVTPEQLAAAADLQRRMDQPCSTSIWAEVNREFLALFSAADGSSRLAGLLDGLRDSSAPYVARSLVARPEQIKEANAEHAALLGMYQQRDSDAVIALTLAHYGATLAAVRADAQGGL